MDSFSKTSIYVIPTGNSFPSTGSSENLNKGQVGIFKDKARNAATAANISTANFVQVIQGRDKFDERGSRYSGRINKNLVKKWYKIVGSDSPANEIGEFSNFSAKCDETLSITLRGFSSYLESISYNGFERSLVIKTPCCECGADPCDTVTNEEIIDLFIKQAQAINSQPYSASALSINTFWSLEKIGTGNSATLRVTAKPLTKDGKFCDLSLNPYEYDRMWFQAFATKNPATTVDNIVDDGCNQIASWTYLQRSTYVYGTYDQVYQQEIDYNSYLDSQKELFSLSQFNQLFDSYAQPGVLYDQYYVIFNDAEENIQWNAYIQQDSTVIFAVPKALTSAFEAIVVPYLGALENATDTQDSTTTTTSTTTTSTSSTTIFIP